MINRLCPYTDALYLRVRDGIKTQERRPMKRWLFYYPSVGDVLPVGEVWRVGKFVKNPMLLVDYRADGHIGDSLVNIGANEYDRQAMRALNMLKLKQIPSIDWAPGRSPLPWRSPIKMPEQVARVWVQIVNIRIQRLLEISEEEACAEGYHPQPAGACHPRGWFFDLWFERFGWLDNQEVIVYEFKPIEKPR